jgi:hypothetical protein
MIPRPCRRLAEVNFPIAEVSKKARRRRALRYTVDRPTGRPPEVVIEVFEPKTDADVPRGTVSRAKAACPACGIVLGPERVRAQLSARRGGADVTFDDHGRRTGCRPTATTRPCGGQGWPWRSGRASPDETHPQPEPEVS